MFKVKGIIEINDNEEDIENKFYVDEIEAEQRDLIRWYNNNQHIKQIIDSYKHVVSFNEAWDKIGVPFNWLHQFYDGLVMTFLNMMSIELDFSI